MKIYLSKINESWIVDRVRKEWYLYNKEISTKFLFNADIIWIISPWTWHKLPKNHLREKKVICSYYHFDFEKFGPHEQENFRELDKFVDEYHVISNKTKLQLESLTNKKITSIPFWVNQNIWFEINNKEKLRNEFGLSNEDYLIGSFQRDTEGSDLVSPKLVKGPDIFLNIIRDLYSKNENLRVVLTGKRRGYLIENFKKYNIPFNYFEMVNFKDLNKLYNVLDLYIVSSRIEGGPQAILEASITKTPIVSTDVGVASEILHSDSIYNSTFSAKPNVDYAFKKIQEYTIPKGFTKFINLFNNLMQD